MNKRNIAYESIHIHPPASRYIDAEKGTGKGNEEQRNITENLIDINVSKKELSPAVRPAMDHLLCTAGTNNHTFTVIGVRAKYSIAFEEWWMIRLTEPFDFSTGKVAFG